MYLSRVEIDIQNRQKIRDLTHLGAYHNWVESSFPDEFETGEKSRKLWRIDQVHGKTYLLVVSSPKPDLAALERYGVMGSAQTREYDTYLNKIKAGQQYRFKAVLNPTYSVSRGLDRRGKVYPEMTIEQQMDYFEKKAEKSGFEVMDGEYGITARERDVLRKERQRLIKVSKVTYEGLLTVTDEDTFRDALKNGIGREKAYGCGLITVIPVL